MVLREIEDFPRAAVRPLRDPPEDGDTPFAVLTEDRAGEASLLALAERYGPRLLAPEVWSRVLPRSGVLISSALSGGTLRERLQDAARAYPRRCWLLVEPLAMEFPLPCPSGQGRAADIPTDRRTFYSEALCCQYTHFIRNQQGFLLLWDTEATVERKLLLAKEAGFLGWVLAE